MNTSTTPSTDSFAAILREYISQRAWDLETVSRESPVLVVFLRHLGCTFCRESIADIARARSRIEKEGVRIALVHMGPEEEAIRILLRFRLDDVDRFVDPERRLYRAFGLERGGFRQHFAAKVLGRAFAAGLFGGHGLHRVVGDAFQMPGVFLLRHGRIVESYLHRTIADRPDYLEIAALECP